MCYRDGVRAWKASRKWGYLHLKYSNFQAHEERRDLCVSRGVDPFLEEQQQRHSCHYISFGTSELILIKDDNGKMSSHVSLTPSILFFGYYISIFYSVPCFLFLVGPLLE